VAHDDAAPVVDFVVGEEARPDALPPPVGAPRRRRGVVLLVVGAALVSAVLVGRALAGHDEPAATAAPSTSVAASADPRGGSDLGVSFGLCPQFTACSVTARLPPAFGQALRAEFPDALVRSASTMLILRDNAGSDLRERKVVVRAGLVTITVQVRARTVAGGSGPQGARQVTRATDDGHYVTVTADVARATSLPSYDRLDRLVADGRLLAQ
jgi:hypothetical protein